MSDLMKQLISGLNTAQLGSFGEFIYARVAEESLGAMVEPVHDNRTDFLVDGEPVDVKASATAIWSPNSPPEPYRGHREAEIQYPLVEFFDSGARISLDGEIIEELSWPTIVADWRAWHEQKSKVPVAAKLSGQKAERAALWQPLKKEIQALLKESGYRARDIYRTIRQQFGDESPANMLVKRPKADRILVYVEFASKEIDRRNIEAVYAYPEAVQDNLPRVAKTRLNLPKVDLNKLPKRYCFRDLDDFGKNWKRVLD